MTAASPNWHAPAQAGDTGRRASGRRAAAGRAAGGGQEAGAGQGPGAPAGDGPPGAPAGHAELTAVACLMMLERVNYLLSVEVRLPREEMVDRLTAIIFAAFHSP
jgi:hypothetical protein